MTTRAEVEAFLSGRTLAVVGVSRSGKKFGNTIYRELRGKGYRLVPVHPEAERIEGDRCVRSLGELPGPVDGAVLVTPPAVTEALVEEAAAAGVPRLWLQQGAASERAVALCRERGIPCVHGECILMFAEPTAGIHRLHRWLWRLLGKLPA
jgi:predicted CoA-binding protein